MSRRSVVVLSIVALALLSFAGYVLHYRYMRPTHILVVNPLPAQAAEINLNNDNPSIRVTCVTMDEASDFEAYDAVLMFGRGLYLDSLQMASLDKAAVKGIPIFTNTLRNFTVTPIHNLDSAAVERLDHYLRNPCQANYRNVLRYMRSIATPDRLGDMSWSEPVDLPNNMYYHVRGGQYFDSKSDLTSFLKSEGLYHEDAPDVAFVSGINFPVEGNRAHIDTLIARVTNAGYNVYPLSASGSNRARMLREVNPQAIIYLPMGRLGNDTLVGWAYDNNIPLFMPFPLIQSREEWLDVNNPMSAGTLTARIVVPEIDGAMTPLCISTQDADKDGYLVYNPDPERIDAFIEQFTGFMSLRDKSNYDKRVAIGYFRMPGQDALLASGMEVIPSLYAFLCRLKAEGYNLSGLPRTLDAFRREIIGRGAVLASYSGAEMQRYIARTSLTWIDADTYESWAREVLLPEKYAEVESRYGHAPGRLLVKNDSIGIAMLRYGNVMLFPQPRPALGEDEFRLTHGVKIAPPHSYLAPYLYMQKSFDADVLIHFGTHGNLEFTPGKNAGLSQADWAEVLIGNRPHFYFYTTGNVGEGIIAKRRSHAVLVSHLTPPFVESGLRQKYAALLEMIHDAIGDPVKNTMSVKKAIITLGIARDLGLDSLSAVPYDVKELERIDSYAEELCNEKITGAYYVMGTPYSKDDMLTTVTAIMADKIAYLRARADRDMGRITTVQLQDHSFLSHHYLPQVRTDIATWLAGGGESGSEERREVLECHDKLMNSPVSEFDAMVGLLSGRPVRPAPGGDPVINPNVLPTGRNMYSINAEATPSQKAWNDGVALAEKTVADYMAKNGVYPEKIAYSLWAGEFISSQGATIAQALRMLGVEPLRDEQGRVMDLRLTPSEELGRPRINIMVQVSGQLRDIAASRLKLLTEAVRMASESKDDIYPNYVAEATETQKLRLVAQGVDADRAQTLSVMRVFGPVNSGYSTGMIGYTQNSGAWDDVSELADGYIGNMCAMYGDDDNWGTADRNLFVSAVTNTDMIVQPRQSNTWGPVSLDHVYEFSGGLSLTVSSVSDGRQPEAVMSDYRNSYVPRMQNLDDAVAVETRATILNPQFIKERMKGDATTAQSFAKTFQNIFGWSATRPDALTDNIYDDLYDMYIMDVNNLGIAEYFDRVNPTALREMTETMLESARKGFWKPTDEQLNNISALRSSTQRYEQLIVNEMDEKGATSTSGPSTSADEIGDLNNVAKISAWQVVVAVVILLLLIFTAGYCYRMKKNE